MMVICTEFESSQREAIVHVDHVEQRLRVQRNSVRRVGQQLQRALDVVSEGFGSARRLQRHDGDGGRLTQTPQHARAVTTEAKTRRLVESVRVRREGADCMRRVQLHTRRGDKRDKRATETKTWTIRGEESQSCLE